MPQVCENAPLVTGMPYSMKVNVPGTPAGFLRLVKAVDPPCQYTIELVDSPISRYFVTFEVAGKPSGTPIRSSDQVTLVLPRGGDVVNFLQVSPTPFATLWGSEGEPSFNISYLPVIKPVNQSDVPRQGIDVFLMVDNVSAGIVLPCLIEKALVLTPQASDPQTTLPITFQFLNAIGGIDLTCPLGQVCDMTTEMCHAIGPPKCVVDKDCPTGYTCVNEICIITPQPPGPPPGPPPSPPSPPSSKNNGLPVLFGIIALVAILGYILWRKKRKIQN